MTARIPRRATAETGFGTSPMRYFWLERPFSNLEDPATQARLASMMREDPLRLRRYCLEIVPPADRVASRDWWYANAVEGLGE